MMAAIAAAAGIWTAGVAAQPAALTRPVGHVRQLTPETGRFAPPAQGTNHAQLDALLRTAVAAKATASAATAHKKTAPTPRQIALSLLHRFGWSARQFPYLNRLWYVHAENVYSGAYGIPQAVPGVKMSAAGPNWRTSARTQILWGLRYIKGRYGSPAGAWSHELATGWY
jgi:resuscitation-promoting factor RpfB